MPNNYSSVIYLANIFFRILSIYLLSCTKWLTMVYFMQVGACIVSSDKKILATGYNGMPWGCNDSEMPWLSKGDDYNYTATKTPYGEYLNTLHGGA